MTNLDNLFLPWTQDAGEDMPIDQALTLAQWRTKIDALVDKYGAETRMTITSSGYDAPDIILSESEELERQRTDAKRDHERKKQRKARDEATRKKRALAKIMDARKPEDEVWLVHIEGEDQVVICKPDGLKSFDKMWKFSSLPEFKYIRKLP